MKSRTSGGSVVVVVWGTVVEGAGAVVVGASWVTGTMEVETTGEVSPPPHEAISDSTAPNTSASGFMSIRLQPVHVSVRSGVCANHIHKDAEDSESDECSHESSP